MESKFIIFVVFAALAQNFAATDAVTAEDLADKLNTIHEAAEKLRDDIQVIIDDIIAAILDRSNSVEISGAYFEDGLIHYKQFWDDTVVAAEPAANNADVLTANTEVIYAELEAHLETIFSAISASTEEQATKREEIKAGFVYVWTAAFETIAAALNNDALTETTGLVQEITTSWAVMAGELMADAITVASADPNEAQREALAELGKLIYALANAEISLKTTYLQYVVAYNYADEDAAIIDDFSEITELGWETNYAFTDAWLQMLQIANNREDLSSETQQSIHSLLTTAIVNTLRASNLIASTDSEIDTTETAAVVLTVIESFKNVLDIYRNVDSSDIVEKLEEAKLEFVSRATAALEAVYEWIKTVVESVERDGTEVDDIWTKGSEDFTDSLNEFLKAFEDGLTESSVPKIIYDLLEETSRKYHLIGAYNLAEILKGLDVEVNVSLLFNRD